MDSHHFPSDPYRLQRLALLSTADPPAIDTVRSMLDTLTEGELDQLFLLILDQGLQLFWLGIFHAIPDAPFVQANLERLKHHCLDTARRYLAQKKTILEIDRIFARENIPYVLFKGTHIREVLYSNPAVRPAVDVDILIAPEKKLACIGALCADGYSLDANKANVSHEVSLVKDGVGLDLHWHILRPGRTRIDLTESILRSRSRLNFFWAPDKEMTLVVMLSHPVFTKYSTTSQAAIVRIADLQRWISIPGIDWRRVFAVLDAAGLKTAAWVTATVLKKLTGATLPAAVYQAISPRPLQRSWLQFWLDRNLPLKLARYPVLPKYLFTLSAHDSLGDVLRFISVYRRGIAENDKEFDDIVKASIQGNSR